jgi:hypothetical protein
MSAENVSSKLLGFRKRTDEIKDNSNLSDAGKMKEYRKLDDEVSEYQTTAQALLSSAWADVRKKSDSLGAKMEAARESFESQWNYERLNFQSSSVVQKVQSINRIEDAASEYQKAVSSGDTHSLRAWGSVGAAAVKSRFPGVEGNRLSNEMKADYEALMTSPEIEAVSAAGEKFGAEIGELYEITVEASEFYGRAGDIGMGYDNGFSGLLRGVHKSQKFDAENMQLITNYELEASITA